MTKISDVKDRSPNQNLILELNNLLKEAESGEVRSVIYVASYEDQGTKNGWAIDPRSHRKILLAELVLLQNDFAVDIDGNSIIGRFMSGEDT